tara:strand:- start:202 stop:321 length:120 start_codon:yes stop_codon:yes gene_type:complete
MNNLNITFKSGKTRPILYARMVSKIFLRKVLKKFNEKKF